MKSTEYATELKLVAESESGTFNLAFQTFQIHLTGGPVCISEVTAQQVNSSKLGLVLADAESQRKPSGSGETVKHRITPDELLPIAKNLCIYEYQGGRLQDKHAQNYAGWIELQSTKGNAPKLRYAYNIEVYRNVTDQIPYKNASADYKGPLPAHDKVKVYIFAGRSGFFDDNRVFKYIQNEIVSFEPIILRPFAATSVGIVDTYTSTIVVPNGVEIYIDKEVKKPDGSPVTIRDLQYSSFSDGFGESSTGLPDVYDDAYSLSIVWFVVDAKDASAVDAYVDQIRKLIDDEASKCSQFIEIHPERQGSPCPPTLRE